jgi:hypothetical protein
VNSVPATTHARLSASAAERWFNCPGSVALTAGMSSRSEAAAQGTFAHHIASECLMHGDKWPRDWLGNKTVIDGFTVECDQEMVDGVLFYLDTIREDAVPGDVPHVEVRLTDDLAKLHPSLGGTADYARWRPATRELLVCDLKYGSGVAVGAEDNRQLLTYALGVMLRLKVGADKVTVRIVQPRLEIDGQKVRDWTFDGKAIMDFAADLLEAANAASRPDAPLVAGYWCRKTFCPAARTCPAIEKYHHAMVAADFDVNVPVTAETLEKVAQALAMVGPLEAKIKQVEAYAYELANRGLEIPGYKLVEKRATRKWKDPEMVALWAKERGVEPYAEPELLSVAQLEKKLRKEEKAELAPLYEKVSSGTTLVPASDSRPVANRISADDFAALPAPQTGKSMADLF